MATKEVTSQYQAGANHAVGDVEGSLSDDRLWTSGEVEKFLGMAPGWAAKDRLALAKIPFVRIGSSVRYRPADVRAFVAAQLRKSTSDNGGKVV